MQNLAQFNEDVLFGRAGGKTIWQPRIQCWYSDKMFADGKLPAPYTGMEMPQIFRNLGCSARPYEFNSCFERHYDETIKEYSHVLNEYETEFVKETPIGKLTQITKKMDSSWARLTKKWWVSNEEELKIAAYLEDHTSWSWNEENYQSNMKTWGDLGAPCVWLPRVNVQNLYIDLMGVEEGVYALADYPDTVDAYFESLRLSHLRFIDIMNASPIMSINFGDNIHSGTLPPKLFEKYVLPVYQERCEKLHQAGKFTYSHFDGDNRGLTTYYNQTGLDGIEAITPVPQGDITLEEAKEGLQDMVLIDGIPAIYFDEIFPIDVLKKCVTKILDLFMPHLVLGISDEISSTGDIERIRIVDDMVHEYNAKHA